MAQWREISTLEEWQQCLETSNERPVVVLKHSTACPVSASALEEFEEYVQNDQTSNIDYVLVKVIESRPVSNQISEDLQVKHESPQIILVKNKQQEWNASHWAVTAKHMKAVLE